MEKLFELLERLVFLDVKAAVEKDRKDLPKFKPVGFQDCRESEIR